MDKETLREKLDLTMQKVAKTKAITNIIEFLEGEGAVLVCLVRHEELQPSKISELLSISRARVTNILSSLVQKGYVEQKQDEKDRRKLFVRLTEKGHNLIQEKIEKKNMIYDYVYEKMGQKALEEYVEMCETVMQLFASIEQKGDD